MTLTLFIRLQEYLRFSETALTTRYKACPRLRDQNTVHVYVKADTPYDEIRSTEYWNSSLEAPI